MKPINLARSSSLICPTPCISPLVIIEAMPETTKTIIWIISIIQSQTDGWLSNETTIPVFDDTGIARTEISIKRRNHNKDNNKLQTKGHLCSFTTFPTVQALYKNEIKKKIVTITTNADDEIGTPFMALSNKLGSPKILLIIYLIKLRRVYYGWRESLLSSQRWYE